MTQGPAPFLHPRHFFQMGRIDIPSMVADEFNDWYNTAYIPPYLKVPGCLGARRYVAIDSQPKYLTLYEFDTLRSPSIRSGKRRATPIPGRSASAPICATMSAHQACIAASFRRDAKATVPRVEITTVVIRRKT